MRDPEILKREIKMLTFRPYGTIVDTQHGLIEAVKPFPEMRTGRASRIVSSLGGGALTSYRQIGRRAVSHVMDSLRNSPLSGEVRWLVSEIGKLKPFRDVLAALEKLRSK
jgi:2-haloacid dehalogenase